MEKRVYTLELIVEQNGKLIERLDRSIERLDHSMAKLNQAVSDLRVDMIQGQAALRQDISDVRAELRSEIERKTFWLMTAHYGALLALLGFLGKHFIESYFK
jgi:outer membrane protein TolC